MYKDIKNKAIKTLLQISVETGYIDDSFVTIFSSIWYGLIQLFSRNKHNCT